MDREIRLNALQTSADSLRRLPNVVGTGIGKRIRNNKITDEDVIHVLVSQKVPEHTLENNKIIPKQLWTNASPDPIMTDVIHIGSLKLCDNKSVSRPVLGGVSIANTRSNGTGTLGCIVKDKIDNKPVILSNNHVMSRINLATLGETIEQPSRFEGVSGGSTIASLKRFVFLRPPPLLNQVDGAIAGLLPSLGSNIDISITNVGFIRSLLIDPPINKLVQKSGRSSDRNIGAVISKNVTVAVEENSVVYNFDHQILTTPMLIPGDSGSMLVSLKGELIGLGFAGSDEVSVFNPINYVFQQLNIENYELPLIVSYSNPSNASFFYRSITDPLHDPQFTIIYGKSFYLYPTSVQTANTVEFSRWKTKIYPLKYALGVASPGSAYIKDVVLGRIRTSIVADTVPLFAWNHPNGATFYTTDTTGAGAANRGFLKQTTPIGYVSLPENIQFNL